MTPKEKAKQLYDKYEFVYIQNYTSKHEVKQCALMAVDEIIEEYENEICEVGYDHDWPMWEIRKKYWQQVKEEIKNL
jgi:hypothetical protein